ncbi:hypothetical protein HZS_6611 [Henneguya salminicola]|nr:hypothetical protein HZS_6611 [Henneguya salminicola]
MIDSNIFLYLKILATQKSHYFMFSEPRLAVLSILDAAHKLLSAENFDTLLLLLIENIKNLGYIEELHHNVVYIRFQYKLEKKLYDEAVSCIHLLNSAPNYYEKSLQLLSTTLLENDDSKYFLNLNFLTLQPYVCKYLLELAQSLEDFNVLISTYDLLTQFYIKIDLFQEASSIAFEAFYRLKYICIKDINTHIFYHIYRFLTLSYNCLCLVSSSDWRFIYKKCDKKESQINLLKTKNVIHLIDLKYLLVVVSNILKLNNEYKNLHYILSLENYNEFVSCLCDAYMFESAVCICNIYNLNHSLTLTINCLIDSCIFYQFFDIQKLQNTSLFKYNQIIFISQSSNKYDVWCLLHNICTMICKKNKNVILNAASYMMCQNISLFDWMIDYMTIHCPNKIALLYLSHDYCIESAYVIINLLNEVTQEKDPINPISIFTIDHISNKIADKIQTLTNKIELLTTEIVEQQKLISINAKLQECLIRYKTTIQIHENNIILKRQK